MMQTWRWLVALPLAFLINYTLFAALGYLINATDNIDAPPQHYTALHTAVSVDFIAIDRRSLKGHNTAAEAVKPKDVKPADAKSADTKEESNVIANPTIATPKALSAKSPAAAPVPPKPLPAKSPVVAPVPPKPLPAKSPAMGALQMGFIRCTE